MGQDCSPAGRAVLGVVTSGENDASSGQSLPQMVVCPPGPQTVAHLNRLAEVESPAVAARKKAREQVSGRAPAALVYASGQGSNVTDVDGNRYVDLAAGFGALLLGHGAPCVQHALQQQSERLLLALGDAYASDRKAEIMEQIAALYPRAGARVLLGQSGGDAITVALKTAKLATGRPGVVAFEGAYHGLGYGPLAACGLKASWREAFADQINPHVTFVPYPASDGRGDGRDRSLSAVRAALCSGTVGAVLVEPILGRGGCVVPPPGFLAELGRLAHEAGALLVADEIWTGLGRAGAWLVSADSEVTPDLVCLGKGLGGGLPISACVGDEDVMHAWCREPSQQVIHTATFHGAPLACATALASLSALRSQGLVERSREVGAQFVATLSRELVRAGCPHAVRGRGLMVGVDLGTEAVSLAAHRALLEAGYLVTLGGLRSEVLIMTPALTISPTLLSAFAATLAEVVRGL